MLIQDSLQILGLTILLVGLFQTNVFQAGFVELLYDRFRMTVFISTVYLLVTIGLQAWLLTARWDNPYKFNWPENLPFLYIIHRFMSCVHYYYYKRSVLRLSDPRFYDDAWITQRLYRGYWWKKYKITEFNQKWAESKENMYRLTSV